MTRRAATLVALGIAVLGASLVAGQPGISSSGGSIALPAAGDTGAVVLGSVENPTMYDVYLVSAASDVAEGAEFRDGQGAAAKAVKELTVPSFGFLELTADGPRVVLTGLTRALKAGETVEVTLRTDGGLSVVLPAVVQAP